MAKALFEKNIEFLKFLNLVRTNDVVRRKLKRKDFSVINDYPRLSREERAALKVIDWEHTTFNLTEKDIEKFGLTRKRTPRLGGWSVRKVGRKYVMQVIHKMHK